MPESEQRFIYHSYFELIFKQETLKPIIPNSRGLLQSIQGFRELKHIVWELVIFKTKRLLDIDLFFYETIKESTLDIHLKKLKAPRHRES